MAALKLTEDPSGRMVFSPALTSRLGSLLSTLFYLGIVLVFFLPSFGGNIDVDAILTIIFVLVFVIGGSLLGALLTNQVVIDRQSRTITTSRRLLWFPFNSTTTSFGDVASVANQYYRHASGRSSHDAWRVVVNTRDNRQILINWDGKQDEMAALAQTVVRTTGGELVEGTAPQVSTAQEILDRMRGEGSMPELQSEETAPQEMAPTAPDNSPVPPTAEPWRMPAAEPTTPDVTSVEPSGDDRAATTLDLSKMSLADLEQRIKSDPMDGPARHVLARKYHANGQLERAVALYQEALHADPMDVDAQNDLGVAFEKQRKRSEAEAAYRRAVALDPFSSTAHLNLGLLLRGMKRASEASQEFYQARQNARTEAESRAAEAASTGGKVEPQLSKMAE